jgi:hypothetical protein
MKELAKREIDVLLWERVDKFTSTSDVEWSSKRENVLARAFLEI